MACCLGSGKIHPTRITLPSTVGNLHRRPACVIASSQVVLDTVEVHAMAEDHIMPQRCRPSGSLATSAAEASHARAFTLVAGASTGGHVNELLILLEHAQDLWPAMPHAYVTTMQISEASFAQYGKPVYLLGEADRTKPLRSLRVLFRAMSTAWKVRPDVVVTTGSMPLALFCFWARLFGARIVWIDSVAQVDRMSVSGRFVRLFADVCLVQWPEVARGQRGVEYSGELF